MATSQRQPLLLGRYSYPSNGQLNASSGLHTVIESTLAPELPIDVSRMVLLPGTSVIDVISLVLLYSFQAFKGFLADFGKSTV